MLVVQRCPDNADGRGAALSNHLSVHTPRTAAFFLFPWLVREMSLRASFAFFVDSRRRYWLWAPSCVSPCFCVIVFPLSRQRVPGRNAPWKQHKRRIAQSSTSSLDSIPCALMATLGKPGLGAVLWHPGRCHLSGEARVCVWAMSLVVFMQYLWMTLCGMPCLCHSVLYRPDCVCKAYVCLLQQVSGSKAREEVRRKEKRSEQQILCLRRGKCMSDTRGKDCQIWIWEIRGTELPDLKEKQPD